ncbi:MAG TPA: hypothetical protein VFQ53_07430 [Kofleriaceae bacterium]|nr:hypothetical protein [Kofleriaceae bacterium]
MTSFACGSSDSGGGGGGTLPCPSGNCGKESFRRAVPTRSEVAIKHPTGKARIGARTPGTKAPMLGHKRPVALEAISPALLAVDDQVVEIDAVVDEVFAELEGAAETTPEIETDTEHQWRVADPELPGQDDVLVITTSDGVQFDIDYYIVPSGADPEGAAPVVYGDVTLADDDDVFDFGLTIDLDAYALVDGTFAGQGEIVIASMPLAGGLSEHWYDYHDVSFDGGPTETSRTTAWAFSETSGSLEFLSDYDGEFATVYARWDETGGRYDHHVEFVDPDVGLVDEIATNCWDPTGAEDFDAWAVIDQSLNYYGELDGEEASCVFGPVEDLPNPSDEFDNLPADGEWETLELLSWCDVSSSC